MLVLQADYPRLRNFEYVMCGKVYRVEEKQDAPGDDVKRYATLVYFSKELV